MAHMRGTLLLALLSVKSSYSREIETALENADDVPDTLQWRFGDGGCWRVRTLAHASRGRPSPRRLPVRMRDRILPLARTRYVGFNDHHLCEKLREVEGCSLGRETLRRLLRQNGLGSPKKRRAP